jgi:diaminopimelate epimerase
MRIEKWVGAGNDFILVERDALPPGADPAALARTLCRRRLSVGADGLLVISEAGARYWNADGSAAAFCGNGARCVAAYLLSGSGATHVDFRLGEVPSRGWREAAEVAVEVPPPRVVERDGSSAELLSDLGLRSAGGVEASRIDAGVPHLVLLLRGTPAESLIRKVPALRAHARFLPEGTNVTLMWRDEMGVANIRTWERGVDAETLACGSGALAAAAALTVTSAEGSFVTIGLRTRGGALLTVEQRATGWVLRGPAQRIFRGNLEPSLAAGGRSLPGL